MRLWRERQGRRHVQVHTVLQQVDGACRRAASACARPHLRSTEPAVHRVVDGHPPAATGGMRSQAAVGREPPAAGQRAGRDVERPARAPAVTAPRHPAVGRDRAVVGQRSGDDQPNRATPRAQAPTPATPRAQVGRRQIGTISGQGVAGTRPAVGAPLRVEVPPAGAEGGSIALSFGADPAAGIHLQRVPGDGGAHALPRAVDEPAVVLRLNENRGVAGHEQRARDAERRAATQRQRRAVLHRHAGVRRVGVGRQDERRWDVEVRVVLEHEHRACRRAASARARRHLRTREPPVDRVVDGHPPAATGGMRSQAAVGREPPAAGQRAGRDGERPARAPAVTAPRHPAVGRDRAVVGQRSGDDQPNRATPRAQAPTPATPRAQVGRRQIGTISGQGVAGTRPAVGAPLRVEVPPAGAEGGSIALSFGADLAAEVHLHARCLDCHAHAEPLTADLTCRVLALQQDLGIAGHDDGACDADRRATANGQGGTALDPQAVEQVAALGPRRVRGDDDVAGLRMGTARQQGHQAGRKKPPSRMWLRHGAHLVGCSG